MKFNIYILYLIFRLVNEECFPYVGGNKRCTIPWKKTKSLKGSGCIPPSSPSTRVNRYTVSPAHRLGNETDIMYEIINSGPVQGRYHLFINIDLSQRNFIVLIKNI